MASRKEQKQQAREQRLAEEKAAKEAAQRRQRLSVVGGVIALAIVVIVVVIAVTSGGGSAKVNTDVNSKANKAAQASVASLLDGVQQPAGSEIVLGDPNAKVTITEFGDLQCSACDAFDTPSGWRSPDASLENYEGSGYLDQIIAKYVRTGKAKLVYRSTETETGNGKTPGMWTTQQAAANAAALQGKGWNFIETFYNEQGGESVAYVNNAFIEGIAKQVPGLDYAQWYKDWQHNPDTVAKVKSDEAMGTQLIAPQNNGEVVTPTIWVKGPKHQALFPGNATASSVGTAVEANL